ncbi:DUF6286 domain-containing protein [Pseudonocardia phyllosphaerae]|uniref:DUF6286 domain-containing protein n=1 Tax=Pseudonocardia phyllosphaerae TaxID=3390502 RepID=UPI0039795B07
MIRRPRRTPAAILVALAVLVVCVLVVVGSVQLLLAQAPVLPFGTLADGVAATSPADPLALVAGAVVALVGLVLLVVALRPGRPTVLPLAPVDDDGGVAAGVTRRSLEKALADAADGVDGIGRASATSGRRRATVRARSVFGDPTGLRDDVRTAVTERLDAIGPARRPRVSASVSAEKGRS